MWSLPTGLLARVYNGVTILLALPSIYIFLKIILSDLGARGEMFDGGALVGAVWMIVPLASLVMVAVANLPSTTERVSGALSTIAFLLILFLAAVPLALIFWV